MPSPGSYDAYCCLVTKARNVYKRFLGASDLPVKFNVDSQTRTSNQKEHLSKDRLLAGSRSQNGVGSPWEGGATGCGLSRPFCQDPLQGHYGP